MRIRGFRPPRVLRRVLILDDLATTSFARAPSTGQDVGMPKRRCLQADRTLPCRPDYPRTSTAFLLLSVSAQAFATAEFGSVPPGIVAQPPLSTNLLWSHE